MHPVTASTWEGHYGTDQTCDKSIHPFISISFLIPDSCRPVFFPGSSILLKEAHQYESVPYSSIAAFEVQTAGGLDVDCELTIWTKNSDARISGWFHNIEVAFTLKFNLDCLYLNGKKRLSVLCIEVANSR